MLMVSEIAGLVLYVTGFFLMACALITLRRNYQLEGSAPRSRGQARCRWALQPDQAPHVRFGVEYLPWAGLHAPLTCYPGVFWISIVLILPQIRMEEDGLRNAYGGNDTLTGNKKGSSFASFTDPSRRIVTPEVLPEKSGRHSTDLTV
jgi:hypothetical protein